MLIVLTSPRVVAQAGSPNPQLVQVLTANQIAKNPTGLVSNNPKPSWFDPAFGSSIPFLHVVGRQNGDIVKHNAKKFGLNAYDTIVLAGSREDIQMGKNGGAVLIAAGWSSDSYVKSLGIEVKNATELQDVLSLTSAWPGTWWYEGSEPWYSVRALSDLSSINKSLSQQGFSDRVKNLVKNGGPRLMALLTVAARSMLYSGFGTMDKLMWGVYPSSSSANDDDEVLSDFTHRLRTTCSKVRLAERGSPLFIRHSPSAKRSAGGSGDRTDPSQQIETLHLNPAYQNNVRGRNLVVIDDVTTYGVSFGVAAAFLRKAGAKSVAGIALGKFGHQLKYYEIEIDSDPFAPVRRGRYNVRMNRTFSGTPNQSSQNVLTALI